MSDGSRKPGAGAVPEVRVVLDTNVLFTAAPHHVMNRDTAETVDRTRAYKDWRVRWYLPEIVRDERRYQMLQEGKKLLKPTATLGNLLSRDLQVPQSELEAGVDETISRQLAEFQVELLALDFPSVDWRAVAHRSVRRLPPFDDGQYEKGFRDALVCESFCQLVDSSSEDPVMCRLVLVANDQRLADAARERTEGRTNVRVFRSSSELEGFLNTLVSDLGEPFIEKQRITASPYFYDFDAGVGLYQEHGVTEKLQRRFQEQLAELPAGATERVLGNWYLGDPQFASKDGPRLNWTSRVSLEMTAYRASPPRELQLSNEGPAAWGSLGFGGGLPTKSDSTLGEILQHSSSTTVPAGHNLETKVGRMLSAWVSRPRVQVANGRAAFDIHWSVLLLEDGTWADGTVDDVQFVQMEWD